jgi:hypothetical protein
MKHEYKYNPLFNRKKMESVQILYHGIVLEQIVNNVTKRLLLDKIFDSIKLKVLDKTVEYCGHINDPFWKNSVIISLKTTGERAWFYFTRIDGTPRIFLIPNHIRIGYPYPKIFHVTNYVITEDEGIFDETLFECEVLGGNPGTGAIPLHLLIGDVLIHRGKDMRQVNPCVRFSTIVSILKLMSSSNESVLKLQFKQLFSNREWKKMLRFIKKLDYKVNGIFFYSCSSVDETMKPRLYLDRNEELYTGTKR